MDGQTFAVELVRISRRETVLAVMSRRAEGHLGRRDPARAAMTAAHRNQTINCWTGYGLLLPGASPPSCRAYIRAPCTGGAPLQTNVRQVCRRRKRNCRRICIGLTCTRLASVCLSLANSSSRILCSSSAVFNRQLCV